MKAHGRQVFAAAALLALGGVATGCSDEEKVGNHQIWFMGSVYDGASGILVTNYSISLTFGTTTINATVDATTGRYLLGPLSAWNDYAVTISQGDYRPF